jgi:hypothetical protein
MMKILMQMNPSNMCLQTLLKIYSFTTINIRIKKECYAICVIVAITDGVPGIDGVPAS